MSYEYKIGSTLGGMQTLAELGIIANPNPDYRQFAEVVEDGTGRTRGQGSRMAVWHWDVMRKGESDILAGFLSGDLSAPVYIRTRLNRLSGGDYTWATFSCIMHWPPGDEDIQSRRNLDLDITFTHLVLIPDEEE